MEYCYVCGGRGYCQPVYVINPPGNEQVPFFPFLEHQNRPVNAAPITPEGTVKVCTVCNSYLIRQWYDNEKRGISPLRRMYFMKRIDGGVYSGAHPQAPQDILTSVNAQTSSSLSSSSLINVDQQQHAAGSRSRSSPSINSFRQNNTQLPSEHHIMCFICHNPCLKWDAKTVYSSQVLENKEFFPFLNGLKPPDKAIPLTNEATKICSSCETELLRQWEHYHSRGIPHEYREYRVLIGSPPVLHTLSNANYMLSSNASLLLAKQFSGKKCALCNSVAVASLEATPRFISWFPRNGGMYFPFLNGMTFPPSVVTDSDKGEVLVCEICYCDLLQQWTSYEQSRYPIHLRRYKTRTVNNSSNQQQKSTPEENQPMIAQCHICLLALRDPHTLKTLRSKLEGVNLTSSGNIPYFPVLSKIRSTPPMKSTFAVCDHCYYNMLNQWRVQEQLGLDPQNRHYTHQEYVCANCSCLRAEKMDVTIVQEKIYCLECARKRQIQQHISESSSIIESSTVPPLKPVPSIATTTTSQTRNSFTSTPSSFTSSSSSSSSSVDKTTRTTVVVPPMLQTNVQSSSGYAEALRQLAKQVGSTTADVVANTAAVNNSLVDTAATTTTNNNSPALPGCGTGLSAFKSSADSQKKQPVAAVAPSQRQFVYPLLKDLQSNSGDTSFLPPSSTTNSAMVAAAMWLQNSSPAGTLDHQLASLEWEQQMSMYSSLMRASLMQSPPYYSHMNAARLPNLYPNFPPSSGAPSSYYPFQAPSHPHANITTSLSGAAGHPQDLYLAAMNASMMAPHDPGSFMFHQYQQKLAQELYNKSRPFIPNSSPTAPWSGSADPQMLMLQYFMQMQAMQQQQQQQQSPAQTSPQKSVTNHLHHNTTTSSSSSSSTATPTQTAASSSKTITTTTSTTTTTSAAHHRTTRDSSSSSNNHHHSSSKSSDNSRSSFSHRAAGERGSSTKSHHNNTSTHNKEHGSTPKSSRSLVSTQKQQHGLSSSFSINHLITHQKNDDESSQQVLNNSNSALNLHVNNNSLSSSSSEQVPPIIHNHHEQPADVMMTIPPSQPADSNSRPTITTTNDLILDLSRSSSVQSSVGPPQQHISSWQPSSQSSPPKQTKLYRPFEENTEVKSSQPVSMVAFNEGSSNSIEEHFRRSLFGVEDTEHNISSSSSSFSNLPAQRTQSLPNNPIIHPPEFSANSGVKIHSKINSLGVGGVESLQMEQLIKCILVSEAGCIPNTRAKAAYLRGVALDRKRNKNRFSLNLKSSNQFSIEVNSSPTNNIDNPSLFLRENKIGLLRKIKRLLKLLKQQTCPRSESKQVQFLPAVGKRECDGLLNIYKVLKAQRYRELRALSSPRK